MKNINKTMISGALTAPLTSEAFDLRQIYCFSLQYTTTGTVSTNLIIEVSNEVSDSVNPIPPTTWAPLGSQTALSTVASAVMNFDGVGYAWVRVRTTTGTGNIVCILSAKG